MHAWESDSVRLPPCTAGDAKGCLKGFNRGLDTGRPNEIIGELN